jgi:molybdopterin-guanine dinucleotide biosynthesis protein A
MGAPKAAIEFGGVTLGRRAADALRAVCDRVVAVGPSFDTGLPSVSDPMEGPLVAFASGAEDAPTFLVACDVPFVSADLLRTLAGELGPHDAVVPVVAGRDQPSVSLYAPRAIEAARESVADGDRSLRAWIARLDVRRLPVDELIDVDTPDDLARARALLLERRARIVRGGDARAEDRELGGDRSE